MMDYHIMGRIGEGAHGIVLKAKHIETGKTVAIKKIQLKRLEEGIPNQAFREIKSLQELDHLNIIRLLEVFPHSVGFCLVFEYMSTDLGELIRDNQMQLTPALIKSYLRQILLGVAYMHSNSIMHRDIKPANLLISGKDGILRIADFGLARLFFTGENRPYSHQVATRWYRAPELLYGAKYYDQGVDLWAIGCIFGEMFNRSPLFPGETDIEQLVYVFRLLGTPTQESWPGIVDLPDYGKITFADYPPLAFADIVTGAGIDESGLDLISKILVYDFTIRMSAKQALKHAYFSSDPHPTPIGQLPKPAAKAKQPLTYEVSFDHAIDKTFNSLVIRE